MSICVFKIRSIGNSKCRVTIAMEKPYDRIANTMLLGDILSDSQFEYLLRYWGFIKGDSPMKDAKVTIKRIEDKGQFKAGVTIEILNPVPKTAKFFRQPDPESVVLNGTQNIITKHFDTEEQGRQWADKMLLAVMRKSYGEQMKGVFITPSEIGIKFHPSSDTYSPSLLQKTEEKPFCFGNYHSDCPSCITSCDFSVVCHKKKPDTSHCFGNYNVNAEVCLYCNRGERCLIEREKPDPLFIPSCKECQSYLFDKTHDCPFISSCKEKSKKKKSDKCFGKDGVRCSSCSKMNKCFEIREALRGLGDVKCFGNVTHLPDCYWAGEYNSSSPICNICNNQNGCYMQRGNC